MQWVRSQQADDCPDAQDMERLVAARLGRNPFSGSSGRLLEGMVSKRDDGYSAELWTRDQQGKTIGMRQLSSSEATCQSLAEAAVLALSLAIDPDAPLVARPQAPPPAQPLPVPAPSATPQPIARPHTLAQTPTAASDVQSQDLSTLPGASALGVHLVGQLGLLPRPSLGIGLGGGLRFSQRWGAQAELRYFPETNAPDGSFATGMTTLNVGPCATWLQHDSLHARTCVNVLIGQMHMGSGGANISPSEQRAWYAASVGTAIFVPIHPRISLDAGAEAVTPFRRDRFGLSECPLTSFVQPLVAGIASVGLHGSF